MRGPVRIVAFDHLARALVHLSGLQRHHGDAVIHRADIDAQVAAHALLLDHLEMALAIDQMRDRLVRGILAGRITPPAFDTGLLIDPRLGDVVEVQLFSNVLALFRIVQSGVMKVSGVSNEHARCSGSAKTP